MRCEAVCYLRIWLDHRPATASHVKPLRQHCSVCTRGYSARPSVFCSPLQFAGSGGSMQQPANGTSGSKHGDAAALIALAGAAGLPDGPAGYPFKPEGSNGSDQTGQCRNLLCSCVRTVCMSHVTSLEATTACRHTGCVFQREGQSCHAACDRIWSHPAVPCCRMKTPRSIADNPCEGGQS